MAIRYTWDPAKNAANFKKHGLTFEAAIRVFENFTFEYQDEDTSHEEIRQIAIGVAEGREIFVVFTDVSEDERRIISARVTTRSERQAYWRERRRHGAD
jgi:uncharacterized DUF497 family protein